MADEKIKLALDYGESQKDTVDLSTALDALRRTADSVGGEFGELVAKTLKVGDSFRDVTRSVGEVTKDTGVSYAGVAEGVSDLGRAFNSGSLGAGVRALGELASFVPLLAPFAPYIKAAGSALDYAMPLFKEWSGYLGEFPKAAESIEQYAGRLAEAAKEIKTLTDRSEALAASQERSAKAIAEQTRWRKELAGLEAKSEASETAKAQQKERAANLTLGLGGQQEEFVEAVAKGLRKEALPALRTQRDDLEDRMAAPKSWKDLADVSRKLIAVRKEIIELKIQIPKAMQEEARNLAANAIVGGDEAALRRSMDLMRGQGGKAEEFRAEIEANLPENVEAEDEANAKFDRDNEAAHERRVKREEKAAKEKKEQADRDAEDKRDMDEAAAIDAKARDAKDRRAKQDAAHAVEAEKETTERRAALIKNLGDTFVGTAERAVLSGAPGERNNILGAINKAARDRLIKGGMAPDDAAQAVKDLPGALDSDVRRQRRLLGRAGEGARGTRNLFNAIGGAMGLPSLADIRANSGKYTPRRSAPKRGAKGAAALIPGKGGFAAFNRRLGAAHLATQQAAANQNKLTAERRAQVLQTIAENQLRAARNEGNSLQKIQRIANDAGASQQANRSGGSNGFQN